MYIAIIFLTGIINMFLQAFSRNIIFFYVFAFCTISAIALSEYEKKIGKFITAVSILSFVMLFFISLYLHTLYGGMINDYNIVMIEALTMVLLTTVAILPIKEKSLPLARETFSTQSDERFLTFVWGGTK